MNKATEKEYISYTLLKRYLMARTRWVTQKEITHAIGMSGVQVRRVCNAYPRLALGGQDGYRYARYAKPQDIQHAVATLTQRSIKMLARAQDLSELLA